MKNTQGVLQKVRYINKYLAGKMKLPGTLFGETEWEKN